MGDTFSSGGSKQETKKAPLLMEFDEERFLAENPDVAAQSAGWRGIDNPGYSFWSQWGKAQGRPAYFRGTNIPYDPSRINEIKAQIEQQEAQRAIKVAQQYGDFVSNLVNKQTAPQRQALEGAIGKFEGGIDRTDQSLTRFDPFLEMLDAAGRGETSEAALPQLRLARDELRREESQAAQQILEQASTLGGKRQFGTQRLLAANASDFGRADAALEPNLQSDIIANLLPVLQNYVALQQNNAGLRGNLAGLRLEDLNQGRNVAAQTGLGSIDSSLKFLPPSTTSQLFQLNLARQGGSVGTSEQNNPGFLNSFLTSVAGGVSGAATAKILS